MVLVASRPMSIREACG